ncbi:response regulator transcription factor, partial [Pseudonocardia sp. KRD-182]|nr:response regulator transcription factor [Pseudonocardia oceani]
LAQGRTNGQLARELGVAEKTVRNRVAILLGVLGVADRVQAALLARDRGLLR